MTRLLLVLVLLFAPLGAQAATTRVTDLLTMCRGFNQHWQLDAQGKLGSLAAPDQQAYQACKSYLNAFNDFVEVEQYLSQTSGGSHYKVCYFPAPDGTVEKLKQLNEWLQTFQAYTRKYKNMQNDSAFFTLLMAVGAQKNCPSLGR